MGEVRQTIPAIKQDLGADFNPGLIMLMKLEMLFFLPLVPPMDPRIAAPRLNGLAHLPKSRYVS